MRADHRRKLTSRSKTAKKAGQISFKVDVGIREFLFNTQWKITNLTGVNRLEAGWMRF